MTFCYRRRQPGPAGCSTSRRSSRNRRRTRRPRSPGQRVVSGPADTGTSNCRQFVVDRHPTSVHSKKWRGAYIIYRSTRTEIVFNLRDLLETLLFCKSMELGFRIRNLIKIYCNVLQLVYLLSPPTSIIYSSPEPRCVVSYGPAPLLRQLD